MSAVTADSVVGHDGAADDAESAENEERNGKDDLFDRRPIVDGV